MKTNACIYELYDALAVVNRKYNGNVIFNRIDRTGENRVGFTLKVKNGDGEGAHISPNGRKTRSACWHVHGDFFDALFNGSNGENIYVISLGKRIDKNGGNWQDMNLGTQNSPRMASTLCDC